MLSLGISWKKSCKVSYNDLCQADTEFQVNGIGLTEYLRKTANRRDKDKAVRVTLTGYHMISRRDYGWENPCETIAWCTDERGEVFPYRPFRSVKDAQQRDRHFFDAGNRGFFKDSGYCIVKSGVLRIKHCGDRDPSFYVDRVGCGFYCLTEFHRCAFSEAVPVEGEKCVNIQ